ncbi:MAG: sigE3 [Aeromicrobium sp.]|nr:sigE3 [Aeromicrobium sp.]
MSAAEESVDPDVRRGDAILALYDMEYRRAVRTVYLTIGSSAVAEEIVQDAFVEMLQRWDRIRDPSAYLRRVVFSRCNSWLRRTITERRHASATADDTAWHDPDTLAFTDAIRMLTTKQRAAVVLRYDEGLSEAEIARAIGCRPGTVKSLLSRARSTMKEALLDDD